MQLILGSHFSLADVSSSPGQSASRVGISQNSGPSIAEQISLPKHHLEVLLSDGPFTDAFLPENDSAWFLGQSSLWQWQLDHGTLSRVNLHGQIGDLPLQDAVLSQFSLFVANDQSMVQLQFNPRRVFVYHPPGQSAGKKTLASLKLVAAKDKLWWIAAKKIFNVDRYGKTLKATALDYPLSPHDHLAADLDNQVLYVGRSTKVFAINLKVKPQKVTKIYEAPESIQSLAFEGGQIITSTPNVVVRLDHLGKVQQSVPVEGNQTLLQSDFSQGRHSFLFKSGLVEAFDLSERQSLSFHLPSSWTNRGKNAVSTLRVRGSNVAIIENGRPYIFKIPQIRSLSIQR